MTTGTKNIVIRLIIFAIAVFSLSALHIKPLLYAPLALSMAFLFLSGIKVQGQE